MADSFFGFDTSLSNVNDDEGGGGPSEDEYDALNDETFGQDGDEFDWEVQHEQLASELENSRRHTSHADDVNLQLEASLSQLVLDESDVPKSRTLGSSVWRHEARNAPLAPAPAPAYHPHVQQTTQQDTCVPTIANVCTVEELERQLRQKQHGSVQQHQPPFSNQNYYHPRFPLILQRPPGLQAPVPLPFAPQMTHNMGQINQPLNKVIGPNSHVNQMGQNNQIMPNQHLNQMGKNINQASHNVNQLGQNQFMQTNQLGNFNNQMGQSNVMSQVSQNMIGQNNMMSQNQMSQNFSQLGQNVNQLGQNVNQMNQNVKQMGQNVNQMGQNQMMANGNPFGPNVGQFPHMMNQQRLIAPPPGMNMQRQNFNQNIGQMNTSFRPPQIQTKPEQSALNQQQQTQAHRQPLHLTGQSNQLNAQQSNQPINRQLNQSPQNKASNTKVQKSRIYNNSSQQKNMTSQNLVQLIQNTHPMLQHNNSYHNASHHPMLNNRTNSFNSQAFNNHLFNNQRQNGVFNSSSRTMTNGDDSSVTSEDEYAGLMTPREKQWLINIQILQLNTGTPYLHDFYYTVFLERQERKEKESVKEAHKVNQQNHPFYSGVNKESHAPSRERHNSARHNSTSEDPTPRTYVPTQFENSLGKLQCGSVTAPRKIIDVELVSTEPPSDRSSRAPSRASTANPAEVPREMKRTKQVLLDIEALYLILLRLEELNDPLAISNALILKEREEKQKQLEAAQKELENEQEDDTNLFLKHIESVQRRPKQESPKSETVDKRQVVNLAMIQKPAPVKNLLDENKDDLVNKMFSSLLHADRLPQILTVRKGRSLVCRFVCRVPGTHARLRTLWARVLRALPSAARRDDGTLAPLALHYAKYIQNSTGWSAIMESCSLLSEAFDPARTPHALTTAFTLSCVTSLIEKASVLVNTPEATANERQWFKFLKTLARALKNTTLKVACPLQPMAEPKLLYHLKQLESRSTIEILQRGKTAEFGDLSKTDVTELLLKYLC